MSTRMPAVSVARPAGRAMACLQAMKTGWPSVKASTARCCREPARAGPARQSPVFRPAMKSAIIAPVLLPSGVVECGVREQGVGEQVHAVGSIGPRYRAGGWTGQAAPAPAAAARARTATGARGHLVDIYRCFLTSASTSGRSMPISFRCSGVGTPSAGPAAALEDGVDQALVLRFAVLAQ
ncbi:MAG: hypothetical protein MZV63_46770 [Marinilabiliales bacterium]|nr:hypothetical protein [Marinilabiliales bacterium]